MDKAGDILKTFLSFHNLSGGEKYVSLFSSWRKVAGDDIASHSRVIDLRRGSLFVEVDHPGWMQMLQMRQSEILRTLSSRYPDLAIRMLHFKLTPAGQFSPPAAPQTGSEAAAEQAAASVCDQPPAQPELQTEREILEAIHDENLKNTLLRLKDSLKKKGRKSGKT
ncbi:MAG: DUF721 domain-containing protein [Spirochaetales bacterium]|jgi:hypothetical protein|nr:DUF721 domain-containing protein [Spirochaetales bacterium]